MVLPRRTMGLHVDAAGIDNLEMWSESTSSINFLSTVNRVLMHRYAKGSIFVHQSIIQRGIYKVHRKMPMYLLIFSFCISLHPLPMISLVLAYMYTHALMHTHHRVYKT